jgi:hypothetical protein
VRLCLSVCGLQALLDSSSVPAADLVTEVWKPTLRPSKTLFFGVRRRIYKAEHDTKNLLKPSRADADQLLGLLERMKKMEVKKNMRFKVCIHTAAFVHLGKGQTRRR